MKVALVSNWGEHCGVAEYGANLRTYLLESDICFKQVGKPLTYDHVFQSTEDVDIIHFNYASAIFRFMELGDWPKFRSRGQKTMLTFHDSSVQMTEKIVQNNLFDRIVVHDPPRKGRPYYSPSVSLIPQPIRLSYIPKNLNQFPRTIGTAGFPFPWKGFLEVARTAKSMDMGYLALLSESDQIDAKKVRDQILEIHPKAEVEIAWFDYDTIVWKLSRCAVNVFAYDERAAVFGISASVRMALAAMRPVIVSDMEQFRDLKDYQDEVYLIKNGLVNAIERVMEDIEQGKEKRPKRILLDMNWPKCAGMYHQVYKELVGDLVSNNA